MSKLRYIIILILILLIFTGCRGINESMPVELQNSTVGQSYKMKSDFINKKTVTLYYPDLKYENLLRIVKDVSIYQSGSEIDAVLGRLLTYIATEEDNYIVPFDSAALADKVIVSRNLATVNLTGDFSIYTEKEMFCSIASIVNTLCQLNSIDYVEVLLNGKQMESRGLLVNPMSAMNTSLHLMYLDHINIIEDEDRRYTKSTNILYYLSTSSDFLIAEIGHSTISKENAAEDLFTQLKNEPYYGSGIESCIPQNVIMPTSASLSVENELNVLTIRLESPKIETMENKVRYMMCGGITLTMLSYFEEVNALRILINGQPALEEPLLYKDMFIENIGQMVTVHLPDRGLDYLTKIDFAMSQFRYNSPKERVKEIVLADADYKSKTAKIITQNVTEDDILSVFVHDSICVVNISDQLYQEISSLPYSNRKMFLYSVVNTLTEFENITSVQFLVEGIIYEKLGENLYIETPMLNNPGIVFD